MSRNNLKIRKGDTVKVLSGKDKGKTGKVLRVYPMTRKLVVENVNVHTKFERAKRAGQPGQKISFASPMSIAKVMLVDSNTGKTTRVGYQILENGEKQRIARATGKLT